MSAENIKENTKRWDLKNNNDADESVMILKGKKAQIPSVWNENGDCRGYDEQNANNYEHLEEKFLEIYSLSKLTEEEIENMNSPLNNLQFKSSR